MNVAITYLVFKVLVSSKSIWTISFACLFVSLLSLSFGKFKVNNKMLSPKILLRGFFFALTHICVVYSLEKLSVSITMVYSIVGLLIANVLALVFLKETLSLKKIMLLCLALCGGALCLNKALNLSTVPIALASGFFMGLNLVISRDLKKSNYSSSSIITITFFSAFVFMSAYLGICKYKVLFNANDVFIVTLLILLVQYHSLMMSKVLPIFQQSIVSQTRLGWAILLDILFFGKYPTVASSVGIILIAVASGLMIYNDRKNGPLAISYPSK